MVMAKKIVNTALKAKACTFEAKATGAKAKAIGPEAKAKAKTIKIGLEAPRGQGLASRATSLYLTSEGSNEVTVQCTHKYKYCKTRIFHVTFISRISRFWRLRENDGHEYAILVYYLVKQAKKRQN